MTSPTGRHHARPGGDAGIPDDAPTVPQGLPTTAVGVPSRATPGLFPTEALPPPHATPVRYPAPTDTATAWSAVGESPSGAAADLLPGWGSSEPDRTALVPLAGPPRRHRVWWAVIAAVTATALIAVIALFLAPSWKGGSDADKQGRPVVAVTSTGPVSASAVPDTADSASDPAISSGPVIPVPLTSPASSPSPRATGSASAARAVATTVSALASARSGASLPGSSAAPSPSPGPSAATSPRPSPSPAPSPSPSPAPTPSPSPAPSPSPSPAPAPSTGPPALTIPIRQIACNSGYIVQLASASDTASFVDRVAQLQAAGQLPAGVAAATVSASCPVFTGQRNSVVLYTGPFAGPYDGCASRLAGPADAFIRTTSPGRSTAVSCLCPATVSSLPSLSAVGTVSTWVTELQRSLIRAGYHIDNASATLGTFTQATKDAVNKFQQQHNLVPTGQVYAQTWAAIQQLSCR